MKIQLTFPVLAMLFCWSSITTTWAQSSMDLLACAPAESNFNIQLVNMGADGDIDDRYVEAFEKAAARWSKVVVGDVQDFPAGSVDDWFSGRFRQPYSGAVDDLVIGYEITEIDGPGGTLGSAGSVFVRTDRFGTPLATISGAIMFDSVDFDRMSTDDVKAVILHEMGHVLGLVGTTGRCNDACDSTDPGSRGSYTCPLANAEFGAWAPGSLQLENQGGMGTACGHWEEDVFRTQESSELMTGFFEADLLQPVSRVTVAALDDLGYEVDFCGADIWPATAETQQKWEMFRTSQDIDMAGGGMMDRFDPPGGMSVDDGAQTSSSARTSAFLALSAVFVHVSYLLL